MGALKSIPEWQTLCLKCAAPIIVNRPGEIVHFTRIENPDKTEQFGFICDKCWKEEKHEL